MAAVALQLLGAVALVAGIWLAFSAAAALITAGLILITAGTLLELPSPGSGR
jgi:hypothetical protein